MDLLRVGVIGVGKMAEICHLPILAELPGIELAAFCDTDPANLSARGDQYGVAARYSDHHEMLDAERLDAVCIFIPPFAHTDAETIAAERGIHSSSRAAHPQMHQAPRSARPSVAGESSAGGLQQRYRARGVARSDGRVPVTRRCCTACTARALAWWWKRRSARVAFVENTIHWVDLLRWVAGTTAVSARVVARPEPTPD